MVTVCIIVANGSEDIEVVATSDVLSRGGIDVVIVGMEGSGNVKLAHKTVIVVEKSLADVKTTLYDALIIPGGMGGVKAMSANENVKEMLYNHQKNKKVIGAICAGPLVLSAFGVAAGSTLTSYPSVKDQLTSADYKYKEERVVVDRNLVTSRGPGTAVEFGLKLVEVLKGAEAVKGLAEQMLVKL
uniref:DJ-1 n=1 Tax=Dugesia japonica TaxID=6161 RepID=L0MXG7_DUGJA|nr:DJ-1 [Dugesia japonica]